MKFKYRRLVIRSVSLIMFIYISLVALSLPIGAVVDTSRGEGDDYNVTGASPFPMTVGFAFRSSDDSDYNYITATDVGGYGQEYNRTLTGTDEFTYTFDELNENTTTTRYMNYSFGNIYWSSQSLFGYRYGFQPLTLSVETQGTDEACETIVLRAPEVVFNTYAFDFYESYYNGVDEEYDIADLAYLGIPVISAPQVYGPTNSKYVGTCSIRYSVTDQHGNVKNFNYAVPYDSSVDGYIPLLKVDDLYTYYSSVDPAQNSSKILISDWYVFWDVDYYEWVDTTEPSAIDVDVYGANDNLVHTDGFDITDDIGLTFFQWASHFSQSGYSVEVLDNGVELTYTSGSDTYTGYIFNGIDKVYGSTVIAEGVTYGAILNYEEPPSTTDELAGTWVFNNGYIAGYFGEGTIYNLSFTSNGNTYNTIRFDEDSSAMGTISLYYDNTEVNGTEISNYWLSSAYKTITITSKLSEVTNGEALLTWLKANATKQGAASLITFTIDGTSYQAEAGMTWYDWCNSNYNTYGYVTLNDDYSYVYKNDGGALANYVCTQSGVFNSRVVGTDIINSTTYYNIQYQTGDGNDVGGGEGPSASNDFDWGAALEEGPSASPASDTPTTTAAGEWVKVDSDKRNIVQIGYPLYDTSNGDPDYAAILNYPNFTNYLAGSTIDIPTEPGFPGDSDESPASLTRWLGVAISGFTDVELWPNFSIGGLLAILVSFAVVMMFLKVFAGG